MSRRDLAGRVLHAGEAAGPALVLSAALSFWGGFDPATGRIVDQRHPEAGAALAGRVLALPESRGSGGTPAGLAEAIRRGTAPAAVLLGKADVNLAIGAMIADVLYGRAVPVVVLGGAALAGLRNGERLAVSRDGRVRRARPAGAGGIS